MKALTFIKKINSIDESITVNEVKQKILDSLNKLLSESKKLESDINLEVSKVKSIQTQRDMELYSNKPGLDINKVKESHSLYEHTMWLGRTLS